MKSVESVGKNVELAIENGLKELNVTRDKVTIKVIDAGGIFKKAKVVLTLDSDGEDLEQKRSDNIKRLEELERQGKLDNDFSNLLNSKSILNGESKTVEESLDNQTEAKATCGCEVNKFENCKSCESVVQNNENEVQELSKGASEINKFAKELLTKMEFDASVEISETKDAINIEVVGKDANKIIGKRGDGLNAFQYLCSIIGSRSDRDCGRVYANACDYKEEREQELIKLARKLKYSAIRDEKAIKLEPMSALDRKTIHKALKDDELVATHSEGEEPRRYIVIEPKKQEKLN